MDVEGATDLAGRITRSYKPIVRRGGYDQVYEETVRLLEMDDEVKRQLQRTFLASREIGQAIPTTLENLFSGNAFPQSQSYMELENSYHLAHYGFYVYAFLALRSVLELGLLQVYFDSDSRAHEEIQPWLASHDRTPSRRAIFERLRKLPVFDEFDLRFELFERITATFSRLDAFAHTRGYRHSSHALNRNANVVQFSERSFRDYATVAASVIADTLTLMVLKYPIALQPLPLDEKFGLGGPVNGFLKEWQVAVVRNAIT